MDRAFRRLRSRGRAAAKAEAVPEEDGYDAYRERLPFAYRRQVVLDRVADRPGYDRPEPVAGA